MGKQCQTLFLGAPKSLQMVTAAMKLKDAYPLEYFPGGSDGKGSVYNAGDPGLIPGLGRSPRKWQSTPVLLPGKSHGQRSLVGSSPWGCKESDMTG